MKSVMEIAKQLKPTGRLNTDDIRRVREMLRKGQKPVLDSKGKPVKNLTQKADPVKPMTANQKERFEKGAKQFRDRMKKFKEPKRRRIRKEAKDLMGAAGRRTMKGMRKTAGAMLRGPARKMKK
tara:strand:+ start:54 stop:425 length:372 start_codon:yes stop_codon:yes gene_type:complete